MSASRCLECNVKPIWQCGFDFATHNSVVYQLCCPVCAKRSPRIGQTEAEAIVYWNEHNDHTDTGAMWRGHKLDRKKKRVFNQKESTALLVKNGINFVSKNNGVHLIIDNKIDFWPSTGLWKVRNKSIHKRGVHQLLLYIDQSNADREKMKP